MEQVTSKNTLLASTGDSPVAGDVITSINKTIPTVTTDKVEYKEYGNGQGGGTKTTVIPDWTKAELNVETNVRASGAAGSAPKIATLLKACGLKETITEGTSVVYAPTLEQTKATLKNYIDDEMREITGVVGNLTLSGKVGEIAKMSFKLQGFTTPKGANENNPTTTLDSNSVLVIESASVVTESGEKINLIDFSFDMGNEIKEIKAKESKSYTITDFVPKLTVNAIKTKGNNAHWDDFTSGAKKVVVIRLGDEAGKILEFKAPFCVLNDLKDEDDDGKIKISKTFNCENDLGGDNFSLTYK